MSIIVLVIAVSAPNGLSLLWWPRNSLKFAEFAVKSEGNFEAGSHHVALSGLELNM